MINANTLNRRLRALSVTQGWYPALIIFQSKTSQGAFTPYQLQVFQKGFVRKDAVGPGILQHQNLTVRIYQSDLFAAAAPNPKVNDQLTFGDPLNYTIDDTDNAMLGVVWVCSCTLVPG
jgi:hypothetical protein